MDKEIKISDNRDLIEVYDNIPIKITIYRKSDDKKIAIYFTHSANPRIRISDIIKNIDEEVYYTITIINYVYEG